MDKGSTKQYLDEAHVRLLLERVPAIVWTTDQDLVFTSVHGAALAALGIKPGELVGVGLEKYVRGHDDGSLALNIHRQALAGETVALEGDWAGRCYRVWLEPLYDPEGTISGCSGLVLDVSEQEQMHQELRVAHDNLAARMQAQTEVLSQNREELYVYGEQLREQQEELRCQNEELAIVNRTLEAERRRYQVLFDLAPDGYLVTDLQGVIQEANRAAAQLFHVRQDFMVGKPLTVYVAHEAMSAFYRELARVRDGETLEIHDWRTQFLPRNGPPFEAALTVATAYNGEGERTGLRWIVRDISERVRLEEQIRFQARALDQVGDAVVAIDEFERVVYLNRSAADLYDLAPHEALGSKLDKLYRYEWIAPEDKSAAYSSLANTGHWRGEISHIKRDGNRTRVESTISVLRDEEGRTQGLLTAIRDVTERTRLRQENERAQQQRQARLESLDALLTISEDVLAEGTLEGVLQRVVDGACELTGARIATSGHGYRDGVFRVGVTSNVRNTSPCPPGEWFTMERGGVYKELIEGAQSICLNEQELVHHPAWWGLPEGHAALRGLLGARIAGEQGQANGVILVSDKVEAGSPVDFTAEDEALLTQLATLASLALRHIQARTGVESQAKALEIERARLRAIIESAPEGIVVIDRECRITLTNAAADRLHVHPMPRGGDYVAHAGSMLSPSNGSPIQPHDLPLVRSAQEGKRLENVEMSVLGPDREHRDLLANTAPIRTDGGILDGAVGVFQDVTELRRMREWLRESQERLRLALSAAEMGTWRWDIRADLELRDAEFNRILGLDAIDSTQPISDFVQRVHRDDRSAVESEIHRTTNDRTTYQVECRIVCPDGTIRHIRDRGKAYYDAQGQPSHMTGIVTDITEWAQAQAQIERLRRQNELILTSAGEGILGLDKESRVTFVNPAAAEMLGWAAKDLIGKFHHETVHHSREDGTPYPWAECLVNATLADGAAYSVGDEPFWRRDGSSFPVEYTSAAILEGKETAGAVLVFRDISEQQQAQKEIAELARFPSENPNPVLRVMEDGSILYANEGSQPVLKEWDVRVGQKIPLQWQQLVRAAISTGIGSSQTVRVENRTFSFTVAPVGDSVNLYGLDITQLEQAQETLRLLNQEIQHHAQALERAVEARTAALQASQARFRAIFEEAALGIALVDHEGQIIDSNPALQEMLGYGADELVGKAVAQLYPPDSETVDLGLFDELMAGERSFYRAERRCVRKEGDTIHVNLIVSLVQPTEGQPRFAMALVEDVTERKRAQSALIESEKLSLTGRLAASLAHEINNPLQSVVGFLSLASEDLAASTDAFKYVEIALEEIERAAAIVTRMRDLNRRQDPGELSPVNVNFLIERVLLLTKNQCQSRHIAVQWEAAENLATLSLASDRIQQVILNLVLNAVDAMPGGGQLRVYTVRTENPPGVRLGFADSGLGIPPGELPYLFEPFHTTKETGLGLGLYISQSIVQDHGGYIEVESVPGTGTTFTIWLPA